MVGPLTEKLLPTAWNAVRVWAWACGLVSTTGSVALVPTAFFPKERLAGEAVRSVLLTPDPENQIGTLGLAALVVKVTFPSVHPVHPSAVGVNVTLSVALAPAAREMGRLKPDTLNEEPATLIAETVVLLAPELVKTMIWVSDCPNGTAPNLSFDGIHASCCVAAREHNGNRTTKAMRMTMEIARIGNG
jgi:hypothetical protein